MARNPHISVVLRGFAPLRQAIAVVLLAFLPACAVGPDYERPETDSPPKYRFEDTQALRRELDDVSQKLTDRKLIDQAKGVLMKARGLDEDAAYHAMRKLAMERGQTMAKVAKDVIDMARVLL